MADEEEYDLSEGQRLSLLERAVSMNRKVVIGLAVVAVFALSMLSTLGIVALIEPDVEYATKAEVEALQQEHEALKVQILAYEKSLEQYRRILDASQASGFKEILLDQEQSYQTHLRALKAGMRDLAKMLPGSRTWLEMYDEQMDMALEESRARVEQLAAIQTSELRKPKAN